MDGARCWMLVVIGRYPSAGDLYCPVIPAQAGIQFLAVALDSCFRRSVNRAHE